MKHIFFFFTLVAVSAVHVNAASQFSSSYTDLSKDCRSAFKQDQLEEGQDNAFVCKGYGGFEIFIYFSALDNHLTVQEKKVSQNQESDYSLTPSITIPDYQKAKIEWRMANGKPFAIIVRSGRGALGVLAVRGLKDFDFIDYSVDVKQTVRANEEARRLADDAFSKLSHKSLPSTLPRDSK